MTWEEATALQKREIKLLDELIDCYISIAVLMPEAFPRLNLPNPCTELDVRNALQSLKDQKRKLRRMKNATYHHKSQSDAEI